MRIEAQEVWNLSGGQDGIIFEEQAGSAQRLERLLRRLPTYLAPALRRTEDGRLYFGSGDAGENCIRSMSNICFALSVLIERSDDPSGSGWADERRTLVALIEYLCGCHKAGGGRSARGKRWGLEWQSSWWAAKLAMAAGHVRRHLSPELWAMVERLVVAEADRHLKRDAPTGLYRDTKAEETAWDAEILAVAVSMFAGHANAAQWHDKLIEFLANTFSSPLDRTSDALLDGKPVRERVYTCNIHADSTLENHGSYHFCYVASPLLSKSFVHYAMKSHGVPLPEAITHNVAGVWGLARRTFLNHRFAYISGQDWARYTYGEYFILPAVLWLGGAGCGAGTQRVFSARLATLEKEAYENSDGSFFGKRLTAGVYEGQLGKYETDCFACVALARLLVNDEPRQSGDGRAEPDFPFVHVSPESQTCFHTSRHGLFAFSWSTLETPWPLLLMIPRDDDSLAEWRSGNGTGSIWVRDLSERVGVGSIRATPGGVRIEGQHFIRGRGKARVLEHSSRVEYDAELGQARVASKVWLKRRVMLARADGLAFAVPNDIFNDCSRLYITDRGQTELKFDADGFRGGGGQRRGIIRRAFARVGYDGSRIVLPGSNWINIDNRLGFVPLDGQRLCVRVSPGRNSAWASLHHDLVMIDGPHARVLPRAGAVLTNIAYIVHFGSAERTRELYSRMMNEGHGGSSTDRSPLVRA